MNIFGPSEKEKEICRNVISEIMKKDKDKINENIVNEVMDITYSIGGGYNEETFGKVAAAMIKR
ncbi:MAG: hypothetical protein IJ736_02175 [Firmicutes bacterium]|nr:hypothetical protein [Bacillota bacterium]